MATVAEEPDRLLLTTSEIARRYRRDITTVIGWINDGVLTPTGRAFLRAQKVGGRWLVEPADLVEFIRAQNPDVFIGMARGQEEAQAEALREEEQLRRELGPHRERRHK